MNWVQEQINEARPGDVIDIGRGVIESQDIIVIDKPITLKGSSTYRTNDSTLLKAPGILIPEGVEGWVIDGIALDCEHSPNHGIEIRHRGDLRNCQVRRAGLDGVHVNARMQSTPPSNANQFRIDHVRVTQAGGNGLYVDGPDVNVGCIVQFDAVTCGGWGIYDSGFLGSNYFGGHCANNGLGPCKTDNPNARHNFFGMYTEPGQPKSEFERNTLWVPSHDGAGAKGGRRMWDGKTTGLQVVDYHEQSDMSVYLHTLKNSTLNVVADGDHSRGVSIGFCDPATKTIDVRHAHQSSRVAFMITTDVSTLLDEQGNTIPPGRIVFPQDVYKRSDTVPGRYKEATL